jgi:hypothetical protein
MGYDEALAGRIRDLIGPDPELTEKKMFGGLAFLLGRVDPAQSGALAAATSASVAVMQGREMPGWLRVDEAGVATDADLEPWVDRGIAYARSLPAKQAKK